MYPPDSTTTSARGRSHSGTSEPELQRCIACPYPGLVPSTAMVNHVVKCHRGMGFGCAVCLHESVQTSLLNIEDMKEHIRIAHKVTSEDLMSIAIVLPSSLTQFNCKLCLSTFLSQPKVKEHISNTHGAFYVINITNYFKASCRLCNFEGDITSHLSSHSMNSYAKNIKVEEDEAPQPDDVGNKTEKKYGSLNIRSDLFASSSLSFVKSEKRNSTTPEVSTVSIKSSPKSKSPSPDIVCIKEVKPVKNAKVLAAPGRVSKYRHENKKLNNNSRPKKTKYDSSSSSSPSPVRPSSQKKIENKRYSSSPVYQPPRSSRSSSPKREKIQWSKRQRSKCSSSDEESQCIGQSRRRSPSLEKEYSGKKSYQEFKNYCKDDKKSRKRSGSNSQNVVSISKIGSSNRSHKKRESRSPPLMEKSEAEYSKSKITRNYRKPNRSPSYTDDSPTSLSYQSKTEKSSTFGLLKRNGVIHCSTCNIDCNSKEQFEQHKDGDRHKNADRKKISFHLSPSEKNKLFDEDFESFPCPCCGESFHELNDLTSHAKKVHYLIIFCKECRVLKHPIYEALTCSELISHLRNDHNKTNVVDADLKYYGEVNSWKQGFVKCLLCPPMKLGDPGFWFCNEVRTARLKIHFQKSHSSQDLNAIKNIELGCQVCSVKFTYDQTKLWQDHIRSHQPVQAKVQTTGSSQIVSRCDYCSELLQKDLHQMHIQKMHHDLCFSCKLCPISDRFLYLEYEDIIRHIKMKHNGNNPLQNIIFPGDQMNLCSFSWVSCKICEFQGVGLGEEILKHPRRKHSDDGGLQNFNIFCRFCDKDDKSIYNYDDQQDFIAHFKRAHSDILKHLPDIV